eukprot:scaffold192_cov320-Ochromonas_danica.AAC.17
MTVSCDGLQHMAIGAGQHEVHLLGEVGHRGKEESAVDLTLHVRRSLESVRRDPVLTIGEAVHDGRGTVVMRWWHPVDVLFRCSAKSCEEEEAENGPNQHDSLHQYHRNSNGLIIVLIVSFLTAAPTLSCADRREEREESQRVD